MPLRKESFTAATYYHVCNRGVNKAPIFFDEQDYAHAEELTDYYRHANPPMRFSYMKDLPVQQQAEVWERLHQSDQHLVRIVAYCLMPNHYHFLLRGEGDNAIPLFLLRWQDSLARYVNVRHSRTGPLFQGRFRAVLVERDEQLLHLSRYIHLNPLTSRLVTNRRALKEYSWSSWPTYVGKKKQSMCDDKVVLQFFASRAAYRAFVLERATYQQSLECIRHLLLE